MNPNPGRNTLIIGRDADKADVTITPGDLHKLRTRTLTTEQLGTLYQWAMWLEDAPTPCKGCTQDGRHCHGCRMQSTPFNATKEEQAAAATALSTWLAERWREAHEAQYEEEAAYRKAHGWVDTRRAGLRAAVAVIGTEREVTGGDRRAVAAGAGKATPPAVRVAGVPGEPGASGRAVVGGDLADRITEAGQDPAKHRSGRGMGAADPGVRAGDRGRPRTPVVRREDVWP